VDKHASRICFSPKRSASTGRIIYGSFLLMSFRREPQAKEQHQDAHRVKNVQRATYTTQINPQAEPLRPPCLAHPLATRLWASAR
jgi:hypothetical protein